MPAPIFVPMTTAPYRLSGTVYGTLLNHRSALTALGGKVTEAPYKVAPKAPILYVKPRNTLTTHESEVMVPDDVAQLEIGGCLGIVIGRPACKLSPHTALAAVAGYLIVNDISVPHTSFHRPSARFKARDGFCPLGPQVVSRDAIANPDALNIRIYVDGVLKQQVTTAQLVRPVETLLSDVTEFMTLSPGDVLAAGVAWPAPLAGAGQGVAVEIDGLGRLENRLVSRVS
jgi:5-oxopent-3-ene-1,2,5-tricarboxylate decarboxylase/2-hydroxyhepta-2,4-diene-1,7-dioate isomerase